MTQNTMKLINEIRLAKQIILYGAHVYSYSLYIALKTHIDFNVVCFLVTDLQNNPDYIDGIKVIALSDLPDKQKTSLVVVAIPEPYHDDVVRSLIQYGCNSYLLVTSDIHSELMNRYWMKNDPFYRRICDYRATEPSNDKKTMEIFVACNINDKKLKTDNTLGENFHLIQSGSALTEERIANLRDNTGDNISIKNKYYSEVTVTYWLWKHSVADYVGLNHYRRILKLPENILHVLSSYRIDGILPVPVLVHPTALAHHAWYISTDYWDCTMAVMKQIYPGCYDKAQAFFSNQRFYLHNIWILSREHADAFCEWLFTILFEVEKRILLRQEIQTDRYMGYIAENLSALYFCTQIEKLRIMHADEIWLL